MRVKGDAACEVEVTLFHTSNDLFFAKAIYHSLYSWRTGQGQRLARTNHFINFQKQVTVDKALCAFVDNTDPHHMLLLLEEHLWVVGNCSTILKKPIVQPRQECNLASSALNVFA